MAVARADGLWEQVLARSIPIKEPEEMLSTYASGMWKLKACMLRAFYDRTEPRPSDDNRWYVVAELGNVCHEWVVDQFKRAGLWRGDEVRGGNARFNISYRQDLLIEDPWSGEIVPVEVKSVDRDKFEGVLRGGPIEAHVLQLQCYLHFHRPEPYRYGYIFYLCRNKGEHAMFRVDYDPETGRWMEEAMVELEMAVQAREPGGLRAAEDPEECKWCEHRRACEARKR